MLVPWAPFLGACWTQWAGGWREEWRVRVDTSAMGLRFTHMQEPQDTGWGWGGGAARKVETIKRYLLWEAKLGPLSNRLEWGCGRGRV